MRQKYFSVLLGNVLEHFDAAIYAFLAPVISKNFFYNQEFALIYAYGLLAISSFAKPIGAYLFSYIAMKRNLIHAFNITIIGITLINIITLLISNTQYSGCILIILRFCIGIFAGGEVSLARTLIINNIHNTYALSTLYESSTIIGIILASFCSNLVLHNSIPWQIPFLFTIVIGITIYVLRLFYTTNFNEKIINHNIKIFTSFDKRKFLIIFFNRIIGYMTYSLSFILINTLVPLINNNITYESMMQLNSLLLIFDLCILFITSKIQFTLQAQYIISINCIILSIFLPIAFHFIALYDISMIVLIRIVIITCGVIISNAQNVLFYQLFNNQYERHLNTSTIIAISDAIIGKTIPVIYMYLFHQTQCLLFANIYITILCVTTCMLNLYHQK